MNHEAFWTILILTCFVGSGCYGSGMGNTKREIDALVVPVYACGMTPSVSDIKLTNIMKSLTTAVHVCSKNSMKLNVHINEKNIPVLNNCYNGCNFESWANEVDIKLGQMTVPFTIYVMPDMNACQWAGLGYTGCGAVATTPFTRCRIWINGDAAKYIDTYMHELGHNLGLTHASQGTQEYADPTCAMGYCCWQRCFNAPHNEQLGWGIAAKVMKINRNKPHTSVKMRLWDSRLTTTNASFIRIEGLNKLIYLEYRSRLVGSADAGLPFTAVNVYSTPLRNALGSPTVLEASLKKKGDKWGASDMLLTVKLWSTILNRTYADILLSGKVY